jgi:SAM-dependent methyltransferase
VNEEHLALCSSPQWAAYLADDLLPWVLEDHELGDDLLEVGPGPGLATDILRRLVARVTAAELDADLASKLGVRLAEHPGAGQVRVLVADATLLPFRSAAFSAVACLTMLHHIPSATAQNTALEQMRRVLRPGGVIVGSDGLDTPDRRRVHQGDIFVPVDPQTLAERLTQAGYTEAKIDVRGDRIAFSARAGV